MEVGNKEVEERIVTVMRGAKEGTPEKYVVYKFVARIKVMEKGKSVLVEEMEKEAGRREVTGKE